MDGLISRKHLQITLMDLEIDHVQAKDGRELIQILDDEPSVQPEPFINKPCVSEGVCHEDKMKVLEKISAEIGKFAENPNFGDLSLGASCGAMKAIEIINKYITESEV